MIIRLTFKSVVYGSTVHKWVKPIQRFSGDS